MRACLTGLLLLAACGQSEADHPAPPAAAPAGFLSRLPEGASVVVRLPDAARVAADPEPWAALGRGCGWSGTPAALFCGVDPPAGIDPERAGGLVLTEDARVRYLPAADKAALNRALQPLPPGVAHQELPDWVVLSQGGQGMGTAQEEPLPEGDLALRIHHHPLLAALAEPGDMLEAAVTAGGGGLDILGRLVPGPDSPTRELLRDVPPCDGDLLDYIPSSLAVRIETTLPASHFASAAAHRLARHLGFAEEQDAVLAERFLREIATGVAPGIAIGVEFKDGRASLVALGRKAGGEDSPLLGRLRRGERIAIGPLVFDHREAPDGLTGWLAWVAQTEPALEGVPEAFWPLIGGVAREEEGLELAYAEWNGWVVAAAGPRADLLARAVRGRLARGAERSPGSMDLFYLRTRPEAPYVLGVVVAGEGLQGLPEADRAALRAHFRAGDDASAPGSVAVAAFDRDGTLDLFARVRY